jgi:hypothetical protein
MLSDKNSKATRGCGGAGHARIARADEEVRAKAIDGLLWIDSPKRRSADGHLHSQSAGDFHDDGRLKDALKRAW